LKQDVISFLKPKKYETAFKNKKMLDTSRRSIRSELSKGSMPKLNIHTMVQNTAGFNLSQNLLIPSLNKLLNTKGGVKPASTNIAKISLLGPRTTRAQFQRLVKLKDKSLAREREMKLAMKKLSKVVVRQSMLTTTTRFDENGSNF
jgi:hypothetical protein